MRKSVISSTISCIATTDIASTINISIVNTININTIIIMLMIIIMTIPLVEVITMIERDQLTLGMMMMNTSDIAGDEVALV